MIVNKENFLSKFKFIESCIEYCDFASFDIEMTGIANDLHNDGTIYDTQEFRYIKSKEIVKQFEVIQFGLTLYKSKQFDFNEANIKLKANDFNNMAVPEYKEIYLERTFNFHLLKNSKFAQSENEGNIFSNISTFHPAALKFMNQSKFNFDNLYKNGINYNKYFLANKIENIIQKKISDKNQRSSPVLYLSERNQKRLIDEICEITKFCLISENVDLASNMKENINDKKNLLLMKNTNEMTRANIPVSVVNYLLNLNFKKLIKITGFNLFLAENQTNKNHNLADIIIKKNRSILNSEEFLQDYQNFENFKSLLTMELIREVRYSGINSNMFIEAGNFEKQNLIENLTFEEIGFSNVIYLLIKNKTRLIGHNLYFDLLFLYDKFLDDLPATFWEFKKHMNELFPIIYDTKYIVTTYAKDFDLTKLESIYQKILKDKYNLYSVIKQDIYNGFGLYSEIESGENMLHDAGYDSILTGRCFIYLLKAIENNFFSEEREKKQHFVANVTICSTKEIKIKYGPVNFNFSLTNNNILYSSSADFSNNTQNNISKKSDKISPEMDYIYHINDFANKTILALMEKPYHIINFDETREEYLKKESNLLKSLNKKVIYLEYSDDFMTIYEMAKNINNETISNNEFNFRIVKVNDKGAFIEFNSVKPEFKEQSNIEEFLKKISNRSNIKKIMSLKDYMGKFF